MKDRIIEFLKAENKSSAQFAAEIGVQPSGISHILSGRNNPSLDFVIKMLEKYKYLSTEWLLFGKGKMYRDKQVLTLFDDPPAQIQNNQFEKNGDKAGNEPLSAEDIKSYSDEQAKHVNNSGIKRIIWFYENNEFEEFTPLTGKLLI
jgi:transcriptional regulator with XRE-family HTH domain